jgi:hypothetical protein
MIAHLLLTFLTFSQGHDYLSPFIPLSFKGEGKKIRRRVSPFLNIPHHSTR